MIAVSDPTMIVTPSGRPAWLEAVENNWYEGSRWSPHRSWVWFPVQDAKRDLDKFTRYELIKNCRYIYKNSPFGRGLIERMVNMVIGTGLRATFVSSNPDFNKRAKLRWEQHCRRPCVDSRMTMSIYQRIKQREKFTDGEGFTLKTYEKSTGEDKIQGIEADRVSGGTGGDQGIDKNNDGFVKNGQGLTVGYQVKGVKQPYPAEYVVHHMTPIRSGQDRGEPILAAGINTARDIDDILALEKQAVKEASSHKDIIETPTGELDQSSARKLRFGIQYPTTAALPSDPKARNDYYKINFGAETVVLRQGDKYTPYKPDRPGSAWQGFMAFLANSIVLSTGFPPSVVLPVEIGGTDIRRDLETAQRIIEAWQYDAACENQEILEYFIEGDIERGDLSGAPDDWNRIKWHFPKSITVDRGRDAQQDREDVMGGLMSRDEYHGRYGDDGQEYEDEVEAETRRRRYRIAGVPMSQPFKDAAEYVQWMSLDSSLFKSQAKPAANPDSQPQPAGGNNQ